MSITAISGNTLTTKVATAQSQDTYAVKRAELQASQAEELSKRRQAEQATSQPVINALGQPTGALINIVA